MLGKNVMYPFGFDDNGLPTEILTERETGVKGDSVSREEFNKLCLDVSSKYRVQFKDLWQRLGFSCDWDSAYSTISPESQRISQRSFLDLLNKGHLEYKEMPTLWCTKCQTTFAQAEVDDVNKATIFNYLNFKSESGEDIPIATTRPELLCACVSMFIHPDNSKFKHLIGQYAIVPIFGHKVKILADEKADPEKGTGIVMCCTFGDVTDIDWWREHRLETKIAFTKDGKMNERAGKFAGLSINEARKSIIEELKAEGYIFKQEDLSAESRIVNTHERCGTPVEYLDTKQWFIKVVDNKKELIKQGEKVNWYPSYMGKRYRDWVENLSWDWAISRQRHFGVPIPVWYAPDGTVVPASIEQLPVNPLVDKPLDCKGYNPDELIPESDVLDTWATSSITPQLNSKWGEENEDPKLAPMTMRPQAHDIIRTWAFYTVVKSYYHFNQIPWKDAVISGHVIKKDVKVEAAKIEGKAFARKSKISKSKDGDKFSPLAILDRFTSDPVRYWASSGTLGTDIAFDEGEIETVNKLINKIWNSSKFASMFLEGFDAEQGAPELEVVDKWAIAKFNRVIESYHKSFDKYEFFPARNELEKFFWATFCDNYLEFIKDRVYNPETRGEKSKFAAQWTLQYLLLGQLKLFAPYIPHITEDIYQKLFRDSKGDISIHTSGFPTNLELNDEALCISAGEKLIELVTMVRGYKSKHNFSMKLPISTLTIATSIENIELLKSVEADIKAITQSKELVFNSTDSDEIVLDIEMDKNALKRSEIVSVIKPTVNGLKKEQGLKAKSPVVNFYVKCSDDLLEIMQEEPSQIAAAARATNVEFNKEGLEYTATEYPNVEVAIKI
jgi:valyl-tRNA synthetase